MTTYDTFLLCSLVFGAGAFLTKGWSVMLLTLHRLEALEDGGPLLKTALIGAGLGAVSALINSSVQTPLQFVGVVIVSAMFMTHGRMCYLAARQVLSNPNQWYANKAAVAVMDAAVTKHFDELYDSPEKLQAYLDRTYGTGTVDVRSVYRTLGKPKQQTAQALH